MMVDILGQYLCPLKQRFPMKVAGAGIRAGLCWRGEALLVVLETGYLSRSEYPVSGDVKQQIEQCWDLKVSELVGQFMSRLWNWSQGYPRIIGLPDCNLVR